MFNLKLVSDAVLDMSSPEALLAQIIKPGMTDDQKCSAVWKAIHEARFWRSSSRGELRHRKGGTDPILNINSFTPTICQQDTEMCLALWSLLGYSVRMHQLAWHTTSEVYYGGAWRHFDATFGLVTRDEAGQIASVIGRKELHEGKPWMRPTSYVAHSDGYMLGHRMDLNLRKGESLTRYWQPLSKDEDYWYPSPYGIRPEGELKDGVSRMVLAMRTRTVRFEPLPLDAAYANGRWVYQPPLAADWREWAEELDGLAVDKSDEGDCLRPAKAGKEGFVTLRMRSPYVMTGGWLNCRLDGRDSHMKVLGSLNRGQTWTELWSGGGDKDIRVALRKLVNGHLDCLVRIVLSAPAGSNARISGLGVETITHNNPFLLPALKLGRTQITISAGEQLDHLEIFPNLDSPEYRREIIEEKNVVTAREGNQDQWVSGLCAAQADQESYVVFKVTSPGDIRRLRWGGRFLGDNDANKFYYSFDGQNWREQPWTYKQSAKVSQNDRRSIIADYETLESLPPGTREVWLKYWFLRKGPVKDRYQLHLATGLRIDAEFRPRRASEGEFEITYCWQEHQGGNRVEKTHTQRVGKLPYTYTIDVAGDSEPTMQWVKVHRVE